MKFLFAAPLLLAVALNAADISGKWSGDMPTRNESTPATFTFKVDGDKLTGTLKTSQGEMKLDDGKVSGNDLSFSTTMDAGGNNMKILFKGSVSGDSLKMTRQREGGTARDFTLKRSTT